MRLVIQVDSREQKYEHVTKYFDSNEIKWVRSKCVVGDYVNLENPMVVVDRKQSLQEVAGNVCQQHDRFIRELKLAKDLGYRMIILVEESNVKNLAGVCSWYNWRRRKSQRAISGKTLYKIMSTIQEKYGVEWKFTTKAKCGETIVKILEGKNV